MRRPREPPQFQGRPGPACLWPPFRALDRCWREDPPGTGTALAGALSLLLLSWVPREAPTGKECEQSAGVVSWLGTQAGAAQCQSLVKKLARLLSHAQSFLCPDWHAAFSQPRAAWGRGGRAGPSLACLEDHTSLPHCTSPRRKDHMGWFCRTGDKGPHGAGSAGAGWGPRTLWLLVSRGQTGRRGGGGWLHVSEPHFLLSKMRR